MTLRPCRCADLHATYKLAPAGTLRFAQSHRREAHKYQLGELQSEASLVLYHILL